MYDAPTAELIGDAPNLDGLDLEALPREMTEVYTRIVSLRVRLREPAHELLEKLGSELGKLRKIANTYEAYVSLLPDLPNRRAAAYVSASAHQLLFFADQIEMVPQRSRGRISRDSISSDIVAMLLFLAAGYPSDAMQMARSVLDTRETGIEGQLVRALANLARGRLAAVTTLEILEETVPTDWLRDATQTLWRALLEGVQALCSQLLNRDGETAQSVEDPESAFRRVQAAAVSEVRLDLPEGVAPGAAFSTFAGPHHLATLLASAIDHLMDQAVVKSPNPPGVDAEKWRAYLGSVATRRPFVWPNHREAIVSGYLETGVSAVISFPTGAGKSTLAEFKVSTALIQEHKVLYLVPTHSLVWQVTRDLTEAFPDAAIYNSLILDAYYSEVERTELPDVAVMTPERCLTLLGIAPEAFTDIGLLVFDECHLLHPGDGRTDRRSLDAMMCLLSVLHKVSRVDVLLMSAMISNGEELAQWIEDATGQRCLPLSLKWKPTRQARGCVLFDAGEIRRLDERLRDEKRKATQKRREEFRRTGVPFRPPRPGTAVQGTLRAQAYGFFCLRQVWETVSRSDYTLVQLTDAPVALSANASWYLTPNKNQVAAQLAAEYAQHGIKTLVFVQNRSHCESVAASVATRLRNSLPETPLLGDELEMSQVAIDEMGGQQHVLGISDGRSVCHHGLLLPIERALNERLFSRLDGVNVIVATPTLAQGMNLPAEVVIIAGDERFDQASEQNRMLEAHEILNAAGRAGRAGHHAQGVVLVIPGRVVSLDADAGTVVPRWFELQGKIFSKADQCLDIEDPIGLMLDELHASADSLPREVSYFVNRIPAPDDDSEGRLIFHRSLAAYQARKRGNTAAFASRVELALDARRAQLADPEVATWRDQLATGTGAPVRLIGLIDETLGRLPLGTTTAAWVDWYFQFLREDSQRMFATIEEFEVDAIVGEIAWREDDKAVGEALTLLQALVDDWVSGKNLRELELALGTAEARLKKCRRARKFVLGLIPQISYAIGLVTQVQRKRMELGSNGSSQGMPTALATIAACVKEGVNSPELLAIRYWAGLGTSRKRCHAMLEQIADHISPRSVFESFAATQGRVERALSEQQIDREWQPRTA